MTDPNTILAECGLRCTRQRQVIWNALAATKAHPTAEELHRMVADENPGISLATVYNTLEAFTSAHLCHKIPMVDGPARYDADLTDHLHVMTGDGKVMDVPEDVGNRLLSHIPADALRELEERMGLRVRRVRIDLLADARPASPRSAPAVG